MSDSMRNTKVAEAIIATPTEDDVTSTKKKEDVQLLNFTKAQLNASKALREGAQHYAIDLLKKINNERFAVNPDDCFALSKKEKLPFENVERKIAYLLVHNANKRRIKLRF